MNILRRLFGSNKPASTPQEESSLISTAPSVHQVPALAISPGEELEEPNPEALRNALNIFIFQKATMVDKREMLHDTPLLLTPEAVTMCQEIARDAQGQHTILAQAWDFLATLLETAQAHGIDAAMDEWERGVGNEVSVDLLQQWLSTSTHRDERQFLQHHPEMLTDSLEAALQVALELGKQDEMLNPQQRQERVETGYGRVYLVHDIRARISRLQGSWLFSDDVSLTNQAILEGYINWKGGFMLDLPAWLETTIKESQALRRKHPQLFQTAAARADLWKKALERARREALAPEIIAEITERTWDALDDMMITQPEMQEEALAYLKTCLQIYTEERYPYQWATIQNHLGSTFNERVKGDKADNLEQAIAALTASLRVVDADTLPFDWARTQNNLGQVYWSRIQGEKADNLEQAISCCNAALRFLTEDALPYEWAGVQNVLGAIYLMRIRGNTSDNLEQAIACCTSALRVITEDAFPSQWALTQNNLGNAYWNRIQGDKADNVEKAIECSSAALRALTKETSPLDWATIQNGLSNAYLFRIKGDKADNLEQAISCCTAALSVLAENTSPSLWALTQNNLGAAYRERIKGDKADNLEQAIACFTAALRVYAENTFPYDWAKAQTNLGSVYMSRIQGDRADNLELAIAYYNAALRVYTEDAFPFLWALTQSNMGVAYNDRIKGDVTENKEEALACFLAVSRVYTEEAFPFEWARTQSNLGAVYFQRVRGDRADNVEQAIARCTAALGVYTKDALPFEWARTQGNLGAAYSRRVRGDKADNLEQAIACCTAALGVYTRDALPFEWALMQGNLGGAYYDRIKGDKADNLEQAIVCYNASSLVYTKDAWPFEWARNQQGLGVAYHDRIRGDESSNLEQAIACYHAALSVYTEDSLPSYHRWTVLNYAVTLAERQSWDKAHLAYLSALHAENTLYALAASAKEQDAILVGGRDGSLQDAYALVRLGKLGEAAVTLEQGRARGLAAARIFNTADPLRITDATRRADYLVMRDALRQSLAALQQPEEHLLANDTSTQRIGSPGSHAEQNARYLALSKRFHQDQAAFDAIVETIRAASDPADFLDNPVTEASLLATARRWPDGHAVISLVATPWGGMALGAFSANPARQTPGHFVALDLPALTSDAVRNLVAQFLDRDSNTILGGFMFASEGSIFSILEECWADCQRPSWDGTTPLQDWERQGAPRRKEALDTATFKDMAGWLHEVCQQQDISSTLDAACQDVLHQTRFHFIVAKAWNGLTNKQQTLLRRAVTQAFLLREVEYVLDALSDWVMRPLAAWLREEGATTVSIVPGGYLAAFPILSCDMGNGKTFADMFSASVVPNLRSLVQHEYAHHPRSGVATLGNPFPTHQLLHYGQAEAQTIARLGGDPERCRIQVDATKAWLLHCLQEAEVVDASCHGAVRQDYLQSALYLADDILSLGEALNQQIVDLAGLRLLILSACQTAIPDVRGAENEVRSLAVGMLQAGAQAVMASLWPVDDRATYLLIVRFAQEWFPNRHTEPPAAALARAQRWLRDVTWEELTRWQASEPLSSILKTMPDARPEEQQDAFLPGVGGPATVRGDETSSISEGDWPSDDHDQTGNDRAMLDEGQENVRILANHQAEKDPHIRPYAHPFYWAGFQITGW